MVLGIVRGIRQPGKPRSWLTDTRGFRAANTKAHGKSELDRLSMISLKLLSGEIMTFSFWKLLQFVPRQILSFNWKTQRKHILHCAFHPENGIPFLADICKDGSTSYCGFYACMFHFVMWVIKLKLWSETAFVCFRSFIKLLLSNNDVSFLLLMRLVT